MKKIFLLLLIPGWVQAQGTMPISLQKSELIWEGKPLMGRGHTGTLKFTSGTITRNADGKIRQGEFVLDMKSIHNTDIPNANSASDLETHLKSEDFFDVGKYPQASFVILNSTPSFLYPDANQYMINGLITIKGITHAVNFPAKLTMKNGVLEADATFTIDRTKWGINYQSKSVFASLQDGIISDEISISLHIVFEMGDGC